MMNKLQKKWENVLRLHGLSIERGRNRKLVYVGNMNDIAFVESKVVTKRFTTGGGKRVSPEGHGPNE